MRKSGSKAICLFVTVGLRLLEEGKIRKHGVFTGEKTIVPIDVVDALDPYYGSGGQNKGD